MPLRELPDVKARELFSLVTLAEYGSFMAAAAALEISQPTLSRIVQRIERVMGVQLLTRSTRRIEFTVAGKELVAIARRTLDDLHHGLRHIAEVTGEQRGQVVLATHPTFAHVGLPAILRDYRKARPQIQIGVRIGTTTEILEQVCSGVADFGVAYVLSVPGTVRRVDLCRIPLCVIVPKGDPLAKQQTITLANLRNVPMVSVQEQSFLRRMIDGVAARGGYSLRHAVTVPGYLDVIHQVRSGVGVGIVPRQPAETLQQGYEIRPLIPSMSVTLAVLTLGTRTLSPAASSLMKLAIENVRSSLAATRKRRRKAIPVRKETQGL